MFSALKSTFLAAIEKLRPAQDPSKNGGQDEPLSTLRSPTNERLDYAKELIDLGNFHRMYRDDFAAAESSLTKALSIISASIGENNPTYVVALTGLGETYLKMGHFDSAEAVLLKAKDLSPVLQPSQYEVHAEIFSCLGFVYGELRQFAKSAVAFKDSVALLTEANVPLDHARIRLFTKMMNSMARAAEFRIE